MDMLSTKICFYLNKINPVSTEESKIIEYGLNLVFDNILKLILLQLLGFLINKEFETLLILTVFCLYRSQAGGWHSKTNVGCALSMFSIWLLSLIANYFPVIPLFYMWLIYFIAFILTVIYAPKSINIKYFSKHTIIKKKLICTVILFSYATISIIFHNVRNIIILPVILEATSLLLKIK